MNDPRLQADGLAQFGRHGDSMLMHVNPREVQGLQALAQANGTSLTTNPYTGQPEAFNFGNVLQTALPVAAGYMVGGPMGGSMMGSLAAGAATGAGIAAIRGQDVLMGGLMGGLGGYGGHGIGAAAGNVAAGTQAANTTGAQNLNALGKEALAENAMLSNIKPTAMMGTERHLLQPDILSKPMTANATNPMFQTKDLYASRITSPQLPAWKTTPHMVTNYSQGTGMGPTETLFKHTGDVATELGGGNKLMGYGKMAMTGGIPILSGIEPPGLSETDIAATHAYDPTRRLDLEGIDTGLRLLANGGEIGFGGGEGDFVTGNFAAGDFAGDDTFGEFSEVTQAGQFDDFNQFSDFANDPILANDISNLPLFDDDIESFTDFTQVNQPLPSGGNLESFTDITETFSPARFIEGAGDGLSDSIPANIEGQQEARLSDGEFVVPADVVSGIGNGASDAGSAKLFDMMSKIRKRRTGGTAQPDGIRPSDMSL